MKINSFDHIVPKSAIIDLKNNKMGALQEFDSAKFIIVSSVI